MHTGHFYFAKNRTFLLCVDTALSFFCPRKMIMSYLCKVEMSYSRECYTASFFKEADVAGGDIIMVRQKELKRLHVIRKVIEGTLTQREAAGLISLTERQIRGSSSGYGKKGMKGYAINHEVGRLTESCPSKRGSSSSTESTIPTSGLPSSPRSSQNAKASPSAGRRYAPGLWKRDLWKKHRKRKAHRQWRERKDHYGEMLQMDGSHHDWFEGRGPKCVLMGYIDDATGSVYGRFYDYEGTIPAMDSFKRYITEYGLPMSVYLDKHTTYKSWVRRDEFREVEPISQFGRALSELGVRDALMPTLPRPREGSSASSIPSRTAWSRRCGSRA